jgi:ABC-type Fe3+-hydroxamate transport system substrate-binding protein
MLARRLPLVWPSPTSLQRRLLALGFGLLGLWSCSPATPSEPKTANEPSGPHEQLSGLTLSGAGFPLLLVGADGSRASLNGPAQRILATNAGLLDLLSALVEPSRIIGLPRSAEPYSVALARGYALDPSRLLDVLDSESVLSLEADLVLMRSWQSAEQRQQWQLAGLTVLSLANPSSLTDVQDDVRLLGRLCGAEAKAAELNRQLDQRAARLAEGHAQRASWRILDYSNGGSGGWVAGRGTTFQLLCELCGVENAGAEFDGHARCDLETLRRLQPDAFVLSTSTGAAGETATEQYLRGEPRIADMQAVAAASYCVLPATLGGTDAHFLMDAAEFMAEWIDQRRSQAPGNSE